MVLERTTAAPTPTTPPVKRTAPIGSGGVPGTTPKTRESALVTAPAAPSPAGTPASRGGAGTFNSVFDPDTIRESLGMTKPTVPTGNPVNTLAQAVAGIGQPQATAATGTPVNDLAASILGIGQPQATAADKIDMPKPILDPSEWNSIQAIGTPKKDSKPDPGKMTLAERAEAGYSPTYGINPGLRGSVPNAPRPGDAPEPPETPENKAKRLRSERDEVLDENKGLPLVDFRRRVPEGTKQTSFADYQDLGDREKAAVDFNTMLTKAVAKDTRKNANDKYDPNDQERKNYDASLAKMFGDDGDGSMYAPETVALLRQLQIKDTTANLDDFLNLDVALSKKDLANIEGSPVLGTSNPLAGIQNQLVDATKNMQQAVAQGDKLLQDIGSTARVARNSTVAGLGGEPVTNDKAMPGFGDSSVQYNWDLQHAFDVLGQKQNAQRIPEILKDFSGKMGDKMFGDFMSYADRRSKLASEYGLQLGQTEQAEYQTPDEFRAALGLGAKKES